MQAARADTVNAPASGTVFIVAPGGLNDKAGIGRLVTSVARQWAQSGASPAYHIIDPYGPAILVIAPFYFARAVLQIVWNGWRGRIRVLDVHMAARGSVLRKGIIVRLGARLGVPVILHLHGTEAFYQQLPGWAQRLVCRTVQRADRVVVLGERWRSFVEQEMGVDPRRVRVLPNAVSGVQTLAARDDTRPPRMLFLGRLEPQKGLPELLDALAAPRVAALRWSARLSGDGDVRAARVQVAALGLAERVEITGWVPESEVRRCLADADIFVLPSHAEGLSMAVLEAMAFGLAVVTTPVGATEEAVVDDVSGMLVPAGDTAALAAALTRLISDRPLRARLQAGAHRRFCERFDIAAYCLQLENMYRELRGPV